MLDSGETDVARFKVDASGLAAGEYTVQLVLSYTKDGAANSVTESATFTVTG